MGRKENNNKSKLINRKTKLVRLDYDLVNMLKEKAAHEDTTIRALLEGCLAELLEVVNET